MASSDGPEATKSNPARTHDSNCADATTATLLFTNAAPHLSYNGFMTNKRYQSWSKTACVEEWAVMRKIWTELSGLSVCYWMVVETVHGGALRGLKLWLYFPKQIRREVEYINNVRGWLDFGKPCYWQVKLDGFYVQLIFLAIGDQTTQWQIKIQWRLAKTTNGQPCLFIVNFFVTCPPSFCVPFIRPESDVHLAKLRLFMNTPNRLTFLLTTALGQFQNKTHLRRTTTKLGDIHCKPVTNSTVFWELNINASSIEAASTTSAITPDGTATFAP